MKKNILTVIILALGILNLILTAVVVFTVIPNVKKTNNLIDKVSQIIELDLEAQNGNQKVIKDDELVNYNFDEDMVISLQKEAGSTKDHYVSLGKISVTLYTGAKNYNSLAKNMESSESNIYDIIRKGFTVYTKDEAKVHEDDIKKDIIKMLNERYGDRLVQDIAFGSLVFQ